MKKILLFNYCLILILAILNSAHAESFSPPVRKVGSALVNVTKFGAISSDGKDDRAAFQAAINALPKEGGTVIVPAGNYLIDNSKDAIQLKSNMHLKMDAKAVIRVMPNSLENARVIEGENVHDVEISGGKIIGDRDHHLGTTGESGHGISLHGALRVTIRDIKVAKCWGDGFYIGAYQKTPVLYSDDVVIFQSVSTQNRRQGLSITNATNVKIYNNEFSYTNGTSPQFGIDIEPNQINTKDNNTRYARHIEIVGNNFNNNKGGAIQFFRQVYDVLVKGNDISYNRYGVYSVEAFDTVVTGNLFAHNEQKGVSFHPDSDNMSVSGNVFRNNSTDQFGVTNDSNPLSTVIGQSKVTSPHIGEMSGAGLFKVGTNQFAK